MATQPVVFQRQYLGWIIGIIVIILAVLGLLGVVPFDPKIVFGMILALALAVFI